MIEKRAYFIYKFMKLKCGFEIIYYLIILSLSQVLIVTRFFKIILIIIMKTLILIIIIIICMAYHVQSNQIWYKRILECKLNDTKKCTKWQQTSTIMYRRSYSTFCFSQHTHILTNNGPKSMQQLVINDQILGFNPKTGKVQYSKVVAWLHRDTQGVADYDTINTKQNISFEASQFHNVAFVNKEGKIQFKFGGDLKEDDELVGFPEDDPFVSNVKKPIPKRGLYSPFTLIGNFFIFDTQFDPQNHTKDSPMILVHVLSQVLNPMFQFWKAQTIIDVWSSFGWNYQPKDSQVYIHPLMQQLTFVFGSHWVPALQEVKYFVQDYKPSHLQEKQVHQQRKPSSFSSRPSRPIYTPSYTTPRYTSYSPSYSYSRPYSSYGSSSAGSGFMLGAAAGGLAGYTGTRYYSSSSSQRQRQHESQMSALALAHTIMQEIYLF